MSITPKDRQLMELKDTIMQLNRMIQEQTNAIASLTAMLEEEHEKEKKLLLEQIEYLKKKLFGTSSEKTARQVDGQMSLSNEAEIEAESNPEPENAEGEETVRKQKRKPKTNCFMLPSHRS